MSEAFAGWSVSDVVALGVMLAFFTTFAFDVIYFRSLWLLGKSMEQNDPGLWRDLCWKRPITDSRIQVGFRLVFPHLGLVPPPPLSASTASRLEAAKQRFWIALWSTAAMFLLAILFSTL